MRTLVIALCLGLAACSTPSGNVSVPITGIGCPHVLMDDKAMGALEIAYNVPAQAYVSADQHNLMSAEIKSRAKTYLIVAYDALKKARAAFAIGDKMKFNCAVPVVQSNTASANQIIPRS